jgi:hypothetical protein
MRTFAKFVPSFAAGVLLLFPVSPIPAQTTQESTELVRRLARHFSEKPPVQFEILQTADRQPQTDRMVRDNRPARMVDSVARSLLTHLTQERDALRQVLAESIGVPDQLKNR